MHRLINNSITLKYRLYLLVLVLAATIGAAQENKDEGLHKNCATLSSPGHYPDYAALPNFKIERREYDVSRPRILLLRISASEKALDGSAVIRLSCKLLADNPKETAIEALMFDDGKAARNLALGFTDQTDNAIYLWHLRARFELDRRTNRALVEYLMPVVADRLLSVERVKVWLSPGD